MQLSPTEEKLFEFILANKEVTAETIKNDLGPNYLGAVGKLMRYDKVDKVKKIKKDSSIRKVVTCYVIKEESVGGNNELCKS